MSRLRTFLFKLRGMIRKRTLEQELAEEQLSAEALALRELKSVQEQLQALEVAVQHLVDERTT